MSGLISQIQSPNFIVENEFVRGDEDKLFFAGEAVNPIEPSKDFLDILVLCNIFPSKSQARKAGRNPEIPEGFSEVITGKLKKHICILKPTHKNLTK